MRYTLQVVTLYWCYQRKRYHHVSYCLSECELPFQFRGGIHLMVQRSTVVTTRRKNAIFSSRPLLFQSSSSLSPSHATIGVTAEYKEAAEAVSTDNSKTTRLLITVNNNATLFSLVCPRERLLGETQKEREKEMERKTDTYRTPQGLQQQVHQTTDA